MSRNVTVLLAISVFCISAFFAIWVIEANESRRVAFENGFERVDTYQGMQRDYSWIKVRDYPEEEVLIYEDE